jgi:hypothetical protein
MYVSLGSLGAAGCATHADCPGAGNYCEEGECVYRSSDDMSYCNSDEECDQSRGYYCVANMCDKLPPEYYPTKPKPVAPPSPPPATPAQVSGGKPDLTFLIVAAAVAGGLAYFVGRQS